MAALKGVRLTVDPEVETDYFLSVRGTRTMKLNGLVIIRDLKVLKVNVSEQPDNMYVLCADKQFTWYTDSGRAPRQIALIKMYARRSSKHTVWTATFCSVCRVCFVFAKAEKKKKYSMPS